MTSAVTCQANTVQQDWKGRIHMEPSRTSQPRLMISHNSSRWWYSILSEQLSSQSDSSRKQQNGTCQHTRELEKQVKSSLLMKNCSNQGLTTMLDSSVHGDHWIIDSWSKKETTRDCNLLDYNSIFWSYKQLNYPRHHGEFKIERSVLRCQAQWR